MRRACVVPWHAVATRASLSIQLLELLLEAFRPEFLNRLDEIVVFNLLDRKDVHAIIDIQLRRFQERLQAREIFVELTPAAKDLLAEVGWDPQFGARPLKRAIQRYLEDPLARHVIAGEIHRAPGSSSFAERTVSSRSSEHDDRMPDGFADQLFCCAIRSIHLRAIDQGHPEAETETVLRDELGVLAPLPSCAESDASSSCLGRGSPAL